MPELPLGVYGLRLTGPALDDARSSFVEVPPDAPHVGVEVLRATSTTDAEYVTDDELVLSYRTGMRYEVVRSPATVRLHLPTEVNPHALVHPVLTIVAAVHSRWLGRLALHGGAFVVEGRAWAVLAEKMGGKSSLLAGLAARGVPVLTDDLVVLEQGSVLPGPRSVDLRPEAAAVLGMGEDIGWVGNRVRQRVALPAPPIQPPLAGLVVLEWSKDAELSVRRLPVANRLEALLTHDSMPMMGRQSAEALFPALTSAMHVLRRPRSWERFDETLDAVLELAAGAA